MLTDHRLWEDYMSAHMTGTDIIGKGYKAREVVFKAFETYCKNIPQDASHVVFERQRVLSEGGISEVDRYKQEASFCTAVFANTTPTAYWTIYELFSRPDVLTELREEVVGKAVSGSKEDGFVIDVAALKTECPLLLSVYQEAQRTRHIHANIRKVMADTLLDGRYMLKKGGYLQMPGQPIHRNGEAWGSSAEVFDPYRFVPKPGSDRKSVAPSNFVAWGAAPHLCPARQFASTEIMIMVALLAMRVDMKPARGGEWERDPAVNTAQMVSIYNPLKDPLVEVRAREEYLGRWSLKMGESKTRVSLASG